MPTSPAIRDLQAQKAKYFDQCKALLDTSKAGNCDLTEAEAANFDTWQAEMTKLGNRIKREELLLEQEAAIDPRKAGIVIIHENALDDPTRGFKHKGEFYQAVFRAGQHGGSSAIDSRLLIGAAAPSTFANEASGADGGFLVPPEFSKEVWQLSLLEPLNLLPLTDNTEISGNSMAFPKSEDTDWGTTGIQIYWKSEGTAATATKPIFKEDLLRLWELMALVPVTNELLGDQTALGGYMNSWVPRKLMWKVNEAILFGTGTGQPLGALNSACVVSQAKESGQAAATVNQLNISKMVSRLLVGELGNAIWLSNPDVLPALEAITAGTGSMYPIFLNPQSGLRDAPYGMMKGRPIHLSEHAQVLGTVNDISLLSLKGYRTITKSGGIETATSMHLYFDANATAFRWIFRMDGKPILSSPITPPKSSNTRSYFVNLATRS